MVNNHNNALVDSHCHLNKLDLSEFSNDMDQVLSAARANGVERMLSVCVTFADLPDLYALALKYNNVNISVGVHPDEEITHAEPDANKLCELAAHPACVAIGETGLDYLRTVTELAKERQQARFREHIRGAVLASKPLIIHTRRAAEDTLSLMIEERAALVGGVMHCFTESWDVAKRALDLGFYISISGIVTFKNAKELQDVAKKVPLDRLLIETDAPYLAPVPFRGKQNHPALVKYVAMALCELRGVDYDTIAAATTTNFYRLFGL